MNCTQFFFLRHSPLCCSRLTNAKHNAHVYQDIHGTSLNDTPSSTSSLLEDSKGSGSRSSSNEDERRKTPKDSRLVVFEQPTSSHACLEFESSRTHRLHRFDAFRPTFDFSQIRHTQSLNTQYISATHKTCPKVASTEQVRQGVSHSAPVLNIPIVLTVDQQWTVRNNTSSALRETE